jgi:O-antigen ligase
MIAKIVMLIAFAVVFGFVGYMLFTKEKTNLAYVKYMLYAYPFLGIDLLPSLFSFNLFDFITFIFFFFLYNRYTVNKSGSSIYIILFVLFLLLLFAGVYFSEQFTRETGTALLQLFSVTTFIVILYQVLVFEKTAKAEVLSGLRFMLLFSFLFLLLQYVIGPEFSFAKSENINVAGGEAIRYPSFFQDPQKYAQFLSVLSFLVLVPTQNEEKNNRMLSILLAIFSICALLLTGGRAGLGGWLVGMIFLAFLGNPIYRVQLILVLLALGSFAYAFQDQLPIFKRADLESSYIFRQMIWNDALAIHQNHPWVGIGIGNYANYVSLHNPDQFWIHNNEITFYDHPESGYLKLLVEFGLPAFGLLLFMILYTLYQNIHIYAKTKLIEFILYAAAILSWLIGFYTVYSLGDIRIKLLVALVFVLSVSSMQSKRISQSINNRIHV